MNVVSWEPNWFSFPWKKNHKLTLASSHLLADLSRYHRRIDKLIDLTITRLDLTYGVHILSWFMQAPRIEYMDAARQFLHYMKGTARQGILLRADSDLQLVGHCDSNWGTYPLSRKSLTNYFIMLNRSPISWKASSRLYYLALQLKQNIELWPSP